MNFVDIIKTVFEFALVVFTLWAVFNESRFIKLERRIKAFLRRRKIKAIKGNAVTCRTTY